MLSVVDRPRRYRKFLTYDFEWVPGTLHLRVASVYDGNQCRSYRTIAAFIAGEFTHANRGKWFYAHSGGGHDVQFILEYIYHQMTMMGDTSWSVDAKFSGRSAIIVKIKRGKQVWLLLDSLWLFRDKLANIAKSIGAEKGDNFQDGEDPDEDGITDEEYEKRRAKRKEWFATVPYEKLRAYNQNDCVVLWDAVDRFETEILGLGGELQMTIASTGMNLFRRRYLTDNIDSHDYVNECAVHAYTASRVEKFVDEVENSYYYDINSSFPHAMTLPAPGQFLGSHWTIPDSGLYLADVDVFVPDMDVPPLAYRAKERIFFPTGRWRNWFCSADLEALQEDGGKILNVHEVLRFAEFTDLKHYVEDIYSRRKATTDPFRKIVYKYLLNCLYGKFAEMQEKQTMLFNPAKVPLTAREQVEMSMEEWLPGAWIQTSVKEVPHRIVPIATHITAVARRTLGRHLSVCRDRHYCDTDGFSTKERLSTSDELGGLKLEKLIEYGHFAGQKLYKIEGRTPDGKPITLVKGKGFNRMTATRYAELLEGKAIAMERMGGIREGGVKGFKRRAFRPEERKFNKRIRFISPWSKGFDARKHILPKRMPYPNGSTRPWHVKELQNMLE